MSFVWWILEFQRSLAITNHSVLKDAWTVQRKDGVISYSEGAAKIRNSLFFEVEIMMIKMITMRR